VGTLGGANGRADQQAETGPNAIAGGGIPNQTAGNGTNRGGGSCRSYRIGIHWFLGIDALGLRGIAAAVLIVGDKYLEGFSRHRHDAHTRAIGDYGATCQRDYADAKAGTPLQRMHLRAPDDFLDSSIISIAYRVAARVLRLARPGSWARHASPSDRLVRSDNTTWQHRSNTSIAAAPAYC